MSVSVNVSTTPSDNWCTRFERLGPAMCGLVCLLVGFLVGSLAGCTSSVPTLEPVTITFAYTEDDEGYYEKLVQEFSASHPNITVELHPRRGNRPGDRDVNDEDIFATSQFALSWLQAQGNTLNLTPFIEQDRSFEPSDFYPGTLGLFTSEGKTWAIPARVDMTVMFYNQDLFDRYNVPYPEIEWTWDDFLNTVLAVRDPEAEVFGYASNDATLDALLFIYQHGGRLFDDLQNPTRTTFDDPLTIEALEWYARLVHEYNVAPTPDQARRAFGTAGSIESGIYLNKVGLWTGMLSERGGQGEDWVAEWNMRWGVAPLPRDEQPATMTVLEGLFISSQTQQPDACWQWISFLSKQIPNRQVPARRSLAESSTYGQLVGGNVAAVARASMENAFLLSPRMTEYEQALRAFGQALDAIMDERSTPREAMMQAQETSPFQ